MFWACVNSYSEEEFKFNMNKIARSYPMVARYLSQIPVNLWVIYYINEQLLENNPKGGGGTYGI